MSKKYKWDFYDYMLATTVALGIAATIYMLYLLATVVMGFYRISEFKKITIYDNSGKIIEQWNGDLSMSRRNGTTEIKTSDGVIVVNGGIVVAE